MPLEVATTISQLDSNWPNGTDPVDRGDDHLRLIKAVLKATFPGEAGQGLASPITVKESVLNALEKTLDDIKKSVKDIHPVGAIVLRLDNVDPGTLYGGTWTLITGDASLAIGTKANAGTTSGNNTPKVPVPAHSHGVDIGTSQDNHAHGLILSQVSWSTHHMGGDKPPITSSDGLASLGRWSCGSTDNYAHSHAVRGNTANAGSDATINVRGAQLFVCIWKRVS